ncbi:MAG: hypothetical protein BGO26_06665 [Actinobacteria bacterium 69-20]|nr:hypothetical protein [Actinomycetota bacterium]OJV28117.1 MAG: hypothetical protein BGO26_06665 [Actinobacteria bacterium 69-20]
MTIHPVIAAIATGTINAAVTNTGHSMRTAPQPRAEGTTALESLASQAVVWGLAIAVAMVIICAAAWAIGSASAHPQAAAKAKVGILVALAGALLLGAGTGYLAWLNTGQAEAFTADPTSYQAETAAPQPDIEIVDKTGDWMIAVNHYRRATPAVEAQSDPALDKLAASCASKIAGGTGMCPDPGQYNSVKLSPSQIATLSGPLSPDTLAADAPTLTADLSKLTDDPRVAIVGARNTQNGTAALVFMISAGPCPAPCAPKTDGDFMPGIIAHVGTPQW